MKSVAGSAVFFAVLFSLTMFGADVDTVLKSVMEADRKTTPIMLDGRKSELFTRQQTYEGGLDINAIKLEHLGENSFLWEVRFCEDHLLNKGLFSLYLDMDCNMNTGFRGKDESTKNGTDLELVIDRGKAFTQAWNPDGSKGKINETKWTANGNAVYFVIDMPIKKDAKTITFAMAATASTPIEKGKNIPSMLDATRKCVIRRFKLKKPAVPYDDRDNDGDGITNSHEKLLGSDPNVKDVFTIIVKEQTEDKKTKENQFYLPGVDVEELAIASVAEDRFIFRLTFADLPPIPKMVGHLYIDSDNNSATGRTNKGFIQGTDIMVSLSSGVPYMNLYGVDAEACGGKKIRWTANGKSLYYSVDLPLLADNSNAIFSIAAFAHRTDTPKPMVSDSTDRKSVTIPITPGKKPAFDTDGWSVFDKTQRTYGLDYIRPALWAKDTVRVEYDKLEMSGFDIDYSTNLEYGNIKPLYPEASVACPAPVGKYYIAFMTFIRRDYGAEIGFMLNEQELGSAKMNFGNNNYWMFWLKEPVDLKKGDVLELVSLHETRDLPLCYVLFLKNPPTPREQECRLHTLTYRIAADWKGGEVMLSWISENLADTRLEYGIGDFSQVFQAQTYTQVHQALLKGLDPTREYQARAVAKDLKGNLIYSETVKFRPMPPPHPASRASSEKIRLTVKNPHAKAVGKWQVTSGIPFPAGVLGNPANVRLLKNGKAIPADITPTAFWLDYSVKWILVSFADDFEANSNNEYELEFGNSVPPAPAMQSMIKKQGDMLAVDTGAGNYLFTKQGELLMHGKPVRTRIRTIHGSEVTTGTVPAKVEVTADGGTLAKIRCESVILESDGTPLFTIVSRYAFTKGSALVRLSHSILVQGKEQMMDFQGAWLDISMPGITSLTAQRKDAEPISLKIGDYVFQRDFDKYILNTNEPVEARLTGTFFDGGNLLVLKQLWEQFPKGIKVNENSVSLALFPDFEKGYYDSFPFGLNSTKHYFHLREGHFKLRRGMRKTHEILLGNSKDASEAAPFQRPLIAVAPPEWYCNSKAFYTVAVKNEKLFGNYEKFADKNMAGIRKVREQRRDYGVLSFGDWFGERGVHWGNGEYDTTAAYLLEFIRTGNEEIFHLGTEAEAHYNDIDIEHWVPKGIPGKVYIHQVGHTGGYYDKSPKGLDAWNHGWGSATHSWCEGHFWYYFLTGDENARDAAFSTADYHLRTGHSFYYHLAGELRNPAWRLIMNAAAYNATYNPVYLNGAKVIMQNIYLYQDKIPRPIPEHQHEPGRRTEQVGGWSRMLVPEHCLCVPRHRGNANFMIGLILDGIKYYHEITGEEAAKQALISGAYYFLDECYDEKTVGIRYTSCPKMRFARGVKPYVLEGLARAYLWTKDKRLAHPLVNLLPRSERADTYGKDFSAFYCRGPMVLADMEAAGLKWGTNTAAISGQSEGKFVLPDWLKGASFAQGEDYKAQGGGECRIYFDRIGAWNGLITYWEQDIGHWLEWNINIPQDGIYNVWFHFATSTAESRREFLIDGKVPCPEAKEVRFPSTGGFGFAPIDWAYIALRDKDNKPVPIKLTKGTHKIRMTNITGGLAFDFIALKPAK